MKYTPQLRHRDHRKKPYRLITVTTIKSHPVVIATLENGTPPHLNYKIGSISISSGLNISKTTPVTKSVKPTTLQLNRDIKHEQVFYSKSTRTYGYFYFSVIDGQFITETGYQKPHNARQALSKIINSEKRELSHIKSTQDEHGSLSWELSEVEY